MQPLARHWDNIKRYRSLIGQIIRNPKKKLRALSFSCIYPELGQLIRHFDLGPTTADILYLGDSVLERVSWNDQDQRTLGQMVAEAVSPQLQVVSLAHSAYHPGVFYHLTQAISQMQHKPKIVILPVNLRSFSPQWDFNPDWQFEQEIHILNQYITNPKTIMPDRKASLSNIVNPKEVFTRTSVRYPVTEFTQIGQFQALIHSKPQTEEERRFRLKQIFIFYYMHPLTANHPKMRLLEDTLKLESQMEIATLIYITPINYQAGEKFVGIKFRQVVQTNVDSITNLLKPYQMNGKVIFRDWSTWLTPEHFFHADNATEHLQQTGRNTLAAAITEQIVSACVAAIGKETRA